MNELKKKMAQIKRKLKYHGFNVDTMWADDVVNHHIHFAVYSGNNKEVAYCTVYRDKKDKWKIKMDPSPFLKDLIES
ncbi:hypothetical protein [Gimesia sp.]|uniref:hypothetical protein n=1 Tax=Gimesia sp. TaxID=2024833 RepID=UPI000C42474F|nr:hypothetical protein [Gimesia sp.]MAX35620.1 hypothetical protein [Gimesia sp.]HAH43857.1 hypothetical protein [Planctomycetaceae bacterium]|tara:strand:+ start:598 stop:828 length:231 start_codon:yes stop_codon:yes gene_type:complete